MAQEEGDSGKDVHTKSKQIGEHGVIGDLHTVALVGTDGAIDWCCFPHFDSPSIFGALLDAEKGGRFKITPTGDGNRRQMYLPETNVLLTRFLHEDGVGELTDFMPVECDEPEQHPLRHQIIRIVSVAKGKIRFKLECAPGFNYGRDTHRTEPHKFGVIFRSSGMAVGLVSSVPLTLVQGAASAEFTLEAGQTLTFILQHSEAGEESDLLTLPENGEEALRNTIAFWRSWLGQCRYSGRWREMVQRSALALKLLTYAPTGAIVAAPTTSLPEQLGGVRNWDYRYTWI
ncbi:MAG: glycoside hydrolase family 15 protein, partial [Nitrospiraceae bacterium]